MDLVVALSNLPAEVAVFLMALLPIVELRGAIPLALTVYQMPVVSAYLISVVGNLVPAVVLLWLLGPLTGYLTENFKSTQKFFDWLFTRTRHKFSAKYARWGAAALVIFVAIPLPVTGVWTGSLAAFLFGIPKRTSLLLMSIGAAISGAIVTLATLGLISIF